MVTQVLEMAWNGDNDWKIEMIRELNSTPIATNLTEGGAWGRNLLTSRWEVYSRKMLVAKKIVQPKRVFNNI